MNIVVNIVVLQALIVTKAKCQGLQSVGKTNTSQTVVIAISKCQGLQVGGQVHLGDVYRARQKTVICSHNFDLTNQIELQMIFLSKPSYTHQTSIEVFTKGQVLEIFWEKLRIAIEERTKNQALEVR